MSSDCTMETVRRQSSLGTNTQAYLDLTDDNSAAQAALERSIDVLKQISKFEDLNSMDSLYQGKVTTLYLAVPKQCQAVHVVVKVCHKAGLPTGMRKQITLERDLLCGLHHRHLIRGLASWEDEGCVCIVQEYADGGSLAAWFKQRRSRGLLQVTEEVTAVKVAAPLLNVLGLLHSKGIAHRDVKLENVALSGACLKLLDLGLAMDMSDDFSSCEIGTLAYMAPELLGSTPPLGMNCDRLDIWSTGVLVWVLLCGTLPFTEGSTSSTKHAIASLQPPWEAAAHLSEDCRDFLALCLEKDPTKRPSANSLMYHSWLGANAALPADIDL